MKRARIGKANWDWCFRIMQRMNGKHVKVFWNVSKVKLPLGKVWGSPVAQRGCFLIISHQEMKICFSVSRVSASATSHLALLPPPPRDAHEAKHPDSPHTRAWQLEPSRSLKLYNHGKGLYWRLLLVMLYLLGVLLNKHLDTVSK